MVQKFWDQYFLKNQVVVLSALVYNSLGKLMVKLDGYFFVSYSGTYEKGSFKKYVCHAGGGGSLKSQLIPTGVRGVKPIYTLAHAKKIA